MSRINPRHPKISLGSCSSPIENKYKTPEPKCARPEAVAKRPPRLNIEVDDFEGVFLDEFAALLDVFAHERRENCFGGDGILQAHLQQRARLGVHGGGPELLGIHFAEALETS